MSDHEAELRRLLDDAVSGVEPHEGLSTIRARTKEKKMSVRRPFLLGAGGAAVATAAVIGIVAATGGLGNLGGDNAGNTTDPAATPETPSATVNDPSVSADPSESASSPGGTDGSPEQPTSRVVPVYYVGDGPRGPVLFREFQPNPSGKDTLYNAVNAAVTGTPLDPDYRSAWPDGVEVVSTEPTDGLLLVTLSGDVHDRPADLSAKEAQLAIEQVIRTAQGAYGQGQVPVALVQEDNPIDQVLGVPTSEPLAAGKVSKTMSLMNISSPSEGDTVSGKFTATGVNNGFEASVGWQLLKDGQEVRTGFGTAEGAYEEKLYPWEVEVDTTGLAPGEYVLRFHNDDASGGAEGFGPDEDTRTIVVS